MHYLPRVHMNSQWYRILRRTTQGPPSRAPVLTNWVAMGAMLVAKYSGWLFSFNPELQRKEN